MSQSLASGGKLQAGRLAICIFLKGSELKAEPPPFRPPLIPRKIADKVGGWLFKLRPPELSPCRRCGTDEHIKMFWDSLDGTGHFFCDKCKLNDGFTGRGWYTGWRGVLDWNRIQDLPDEIFVEALRAKRCTHWPECECEKVI